MWRMLAQRIPFAICVALEGRSLDRKQFTGSLNLLPKIMTEHKRDIKAFVNLKIANSEMVLCYIDISHQHRRWYVVLYAGSPKSRSS